MDPHVSDWLRRNGWKVLHFSEGTQCFLVQRGTRRELVGIGEGIDHVRSYLGMVMMTPVLQRALATGKAHLSRVEFYGAK
jgi:hypothetical protein